MAEKGRERKMSTLPFFFAKQDKDKKRPRTSLKSVQLSENEQEAENGRQIFNRK